MDSTSGSRKALEQQGQQRAPQAGQESQEGELHPAA